MIQQRVAMPTESGKSLAGVLRIPGDAGPYPAIAIYHGFLENKDRDLVMDIANALSFENFATLRFDFLSHGESHGRIEETTLSQQVQDICDALDFLETLPAVDKERIALVGHDLGGNACLLLDDARVKALVTIGTRAHLDSFFESYFDEYEIKEWLKSGIHDCAGIRLRDTFYHDLQKHNVIEHVQKKLIPYLIFHGTADARHPFEDARALYHVAPNPIIEIIEEADHNFTLPHHRAYMIESMRNFFLRVFAKKRFER
ncbi:alpha/beta fold hydrolase [Candidatus Woesearchaeota archaeon]|nr:alpha/beta fold hydrolase [Candidatus Woesearchaeota archaeon]